VNAPEPGGIDSSRAETSICSPDPDGRRLGLPLAGRTRNDGTLIDFYDEIGINKTDNDPTLSFEAAWGPNGALCVAHTRIPEILDLDGLEKSCPRLAGRLRSDCRQDMSGALLRNRSK